MSPLRSPAFSSAWGSTDATPLGSETWLRGHPAQGGGEGERDGWGGERGGADGGRAEGFPLVSKGEHRVFLSGFAEADKTPGY